MLLPDYPIENPDDDQLHRLQIASGLADLVGQFNSEESFVIGIEGAWGSGKTSFINLALSTMDKEKTVIVKFNPWNFSSRDELIKDFFGSLVKNIQELHLNKKLLDSIVSKLLSVPNKLGVEFSVGPLSIRPNYHLGKTLTEERKEVDDLFRKVGKKIVVVIDDIDRLDTEETRLIMKLVKMTANFPNTIFILAYSPEIVIKRLEEGEEYLKKIVQIPFYLPKISASGLKNIFIRDLENTILFVCDEESLNSIKNDERWETVQTHFLYFFDNIRDVKRFISSLSLRLRVTNKDEINIVDFIFIEAIRIFAPAFHAIVKESRMLFVNKKSRNDVDSAEEWEQVYRESISNHADKGRKQQCRELIEQFSNRKHFIVSIIADLLFPSLTYHDNDFAEEAWTKEKRICTIKYFNNYF